jgi:hypothetical protein
LSGALLLPFKGLRQNKGLLVSGWNNIIVSIYGRIRI